MRPASAQLGHNIGIEKVHFGSLEIDGETSVQATARRYRNVASGVFLEQKFLQCRPRCMLQPAPIGYRHKHSGIGTSPGYELRSVPEACVEELAKTGLCILNWPAFQRSSPHNCY